MPTAEHLREDMFKKLECINNFVYHDRHSIADKECVSAYRMMIRESLKKYEITGTEYKTARRLIKNFMDTKRLMIKQ